MADAAEEVEEGEERRRETRRFLVSHHALLQSLAKGFHVPLSMTTHDIITIDQKCQEYIEGTSQKRARKARETLRRPFCPPTPLVHSLHPF